MWFKSLLVNKNYLNGRFQKTIIHKTLTYLLEFNIMFTCLCEISIILNKK